MIDVMNDSKIVLNTMTWFKDGTHDRVFNGMLAKSSSGNGFFYLYEREFFLMMNS